MLQPWPSNQHIHPSIGNNKKQEAQAHKSFASRSTLNQNILASCNPLPNFHVSSLKIPQQKMPTSHPSQTPHISISNIKITVHQIPYHCKYDIFLIPALRISSSHKLVTLWISGQVLKECGMSNRFRRAWWWAPITITSRLITEFYIVNQEFWLMKEKRGGKGSNRDTEIDWRILGCCWDVYERSLLLAWRLMWCD